MQGDVRSVSHPRPVCVVLHGRALVLERLTLWGCASCCTVEPWCSNGARCHTHRHTFQSFRVCRVSQSVCL